jgi:hypothetical protein
METSQSRVREQNDALLLEMVKGGVWIGFLVCRRILKRYKASAGKYEEIVHGLMVRSS